MTLEHLGTSSMNESLEQSDAMLVPTGRSIFRHGNTWLVAERECKDATEGQARDKLRLLLVKAAFRQLIDEARQVFAAKHEGHTAIYFVDEYGGWARVGSKPSRPASSIILGKLGEAEALLADCCRFLSAERWYGERGIPYRRGYLPHGPPGTGASLIPSPQDTPSAFIDRASACTGQTSLVSSVASKPRLPIYVASLASARLSDDNFAEALAAAAPRCCLLLEDVDAAFIQRERSGAGGSLTDVLGLVECD
jgi:chaperone BCS1